MYFICISFILLFNCLEVSPTGGSVCQLLVQFCRCFPSALIRGAFFMADYRLTCLSLCTTVTQLISPSVGLSRSFGNGLFQSRFRRFRGSASTPKQSHPPKRKRSIIPQNPGLSFYVRSRDKSATAANEESPRVGLTEIEQCLLCPLRIAFFS